MKENIFSRFGTPRAIISDNDTHFYNRSFEALMRKYAITHKLFIPYHPQTSGQVEVSNRQQAYLREDCESKPERLAHQTCRYPMGLQNRFQDDSRDVSLYVSLWEDLPPTR